MSTFVLIHGGCHGAWSWYKMIPRLEAAGHRVIAPDLPGHGVDHRAVGGWSSNDYAASVESILETLDEPVILVGHSMGGSVVQLVGQHRPEKVAAVVYLGIGAISAGHTAATDELFAQGLEPATSDVSIDEEAGTLSYPDRVAKRMFYGDCGPDDVALASMLLVPESLASLATVIERTPDRYGSLPRFGIVTLNDEAVSPELQRKLHERDGITDIFTLPTSHSPFFSRPDELTRHLLDIAGRVSDHG